MNQQLANKIMILKFHLQIQQIKNNHEKLKNKNNQLLKQIKKLKIKKNLYKIR